MPTADRKFRVFLCQSAPKGYASQDTTGVALRKPIVRELFNDLMPSDKGMIKAGLKYNCYEVKYG